MSTTLHILFLGIAFFQMLFMGIQWAFFRRKEYLFYILYIFSASLYILLRVHAANGFLKITIPPALMELLDQPLVIFSYLMYLYFTQYFLNMPKSKPAVYKYALLLRWCFAGFILLRTALIPLELSSRTSALIYLAAVCIMAMVVIPMFVLMLRQKNILNNFIVFGCVCYTLGGVGSLLAGIFTEYYEAGSASIFIGFEIGVLAELLLLNTGFMLKNKILQQQVIKGQQKILEEFMSKKKDTGINN